jgi:hypothetical protein
MNDASEESLPSFHPFNDPSVPPPPLVDASGERGFSMSFREGERVTVRGRERFTCSALFSCAWFGSYSLEGQPIRISGFMPGVTLRLSFSGSLCPLAMDDRAFAENLWRDAEAHLDHWMIEHPDSPILQLKEQGIGLLAEFARDDLATLHPGVMQIDVVD